MELKVSEVDVSICIVSYNGTSFLIPCIKSISENCRDISYEVIIVDNNSTDGSRDILKKEFPDIGIIENTKNYGFARANNQAIKKSTGKYVLLLNQDTLILNNSSIRLMKEFLDYNNDVGICGCGHIGPDGIEQPSHDKFPSLRPVYKKLIRRFTFKNRCKPMILADGISPHETDWVCGACLMTRRKMFDVVGQLDERYFFYFEETDYCYRSKKAGWKIFYLPYINIIHYGGAARQQDLKSEKEFMKSEHFFFKKNYGDAHALLLILLHTFVLIIELFKSIIAYMYRFNNKTKRGEHLDNMRYNTGLLYNLAILKK